MLFRITILCIRTEEFSQVHPTGSDPGQSTSKSHAKDGGDASIVPQKLQEKLPESVEKAVPNALHDTGSK